MGGVSVKTYTGLCLEQGWCFTRHEIAKNSEESCSVFELFAPGTTQPITSEVQLPQFVSPNHPLTKLLLFQRTFNNSCGGIWGYSTKTYQTPTERSSSQWVYYQRSLSLLRTTNEAAFEMLAEEGIHKHTPYLSSPIMFAGYSLQNLPYLKEADYDEWVQSIKNTSQPIAYYENKFPWLANIIFIEDEKEGPLVVFVPNSSLYHSMQESFYSQNPGLKDISSFWGLDKTSGLVSKDRLKIQVFIGRHMWLAREANARWRRKDSTFPLGNFPSLLKKPPFSKITCKVPTLPRIVWEYLKQKHQGKLVMFTGQGTPLIPHLTPSKNEVYFLTAPQYAQL